MSLRLALCFSLLALALALAPPVLAEDHRGGIDPDGATVADDAGDLRGTIDPDGLKLADEGDHRGTIDPNGVA
jgi:hypothetical protein